MSEAATEATAEASPAEPPSARQRLWSVAVIIAVVAAVLWPVVRQPPRDGFPLSTYPMFSSPREPVVDIDLAVGIAADGTDRSLGPELIADTDEVIQAGAVVRRAVAGGGEAQLVLCAAIADRVAASGLDVAGIAVRTDRYDAVGWYRGRQQPLSSTTWATCPVVR